MRLKRVLDLLLPFTLSMLIARSFSIDGGPQKNTPTSAKNYMRTVPKQRRRAREKSKPERTNAVKQRARTLGAFVLGIVLL